MSLLVGYSNVIAINSAIELKASIVVASIIRVAPVSRSMALEPAEKQAAKEYLAPNCVPKDTVLCPQGHSPLRSASLSTEAVNR
jgi:hypothetical protein